MENKKKVWIIGANSDIAKELILQFVKLEYDFILTSRNIVALNAFVNRNDISAQIYALEITNPDSLINFYQQYLSGMLAGVIYCAGILPNETQPLQADDVEEAFMSNTIAFISLLEELKSELKTRHNSFILAFSSIAGERGKASNKIYGATKAALTVYLQGLMQELRPFHVKVFIVKPGFVSTKMIGHLKDKNRCLLAQSPQKVAKKTIRNMQKCNGMSFTVGGIWYLILTCIHLLPERIYKYLTL